MKIVLYISNLQKGGAQRVIANLGNYLDSIGNEVAIITTGDAKSSYGLNTGIIVKSLGIDNFYGRNMVKIKRVIGIGNYLMKLKRTINEFNPDIVITFLTFEINCILTIKPFIKSKVIISVRNDPKMIYRTKFQINRANQMFKLADGIVFQTKEAQTFFADKIVRKSTIIKNPINTDFIIPRYLGERKKKIVTVGKFTEQKNHLLLIDAFSKVAKRIPDYNLVIYGDGVLREEYTKKITELNLRKRVLLPGIKDNIKECIYDASLFVLSSNYEGVSNALLEAMALGLPVISTDCPCGGSREIIDDGINGLLVPVKDIERMSSEMKRVLSDTELMNNLGENAIKIQKTLNPGLINGQWGKYLLDSLDRRE